ncbi:class I SAM-dependent methyltransferase [Cryptosporangium sp. NPDC051539]|uniref:class I SAM-dependent methyltransferase n=1 Tax=Cryptosporangium sp. NPDC051539 TaxID=3363962 RepID=UPI0037A4E3F9
MTTYALGHTHDEYERLRIQARRWEAATGRVLDAVGLAPGARCLDAGCGPGETMRLMAQRVGPSGAVLGVDKDAALLGRTREMLHDAGHRHCDVRVHDLAGPDPLPDGPFDLVYARLLLFHLPERADVVKRLWEAVAPGGHLVVHDYDLSAVSTHPMLDDFDEMGRIIGETFAVAGCDTRVGSALPSLIRQAGAGEPDGSDVAGLLEPLADARDFLEATFRSLLPLALVRGVTTDREAEYLLDALDRDAARYPDRPVLMPLLIGAWKRK